MSGWIRFSKPPRLISAASVVGKREFEGPLGDLFDMHDGSTGFFDGADRFGQPTWEQSEAEMQRLAFNLAVSKLGASEDAIGALFAGDLINQCTGSAYGLLNYNIPFFGLYGACSTAAEGLILSAMTVAAGYFDRAAAVTSSHNCSAERQFRFPLEYGGQRTPTSQWTVTGSGAFVIGTEPVPGSPEIVSCCIGITREKGITDINNMGAAMAPAAVDTLQRYFTESGTAPSDYDLIVTGDLGYEGHGIVLDMMKADGYDLSANYNDCGLLIYHRSGQDMHAGGSGCGCSAVVLAAYLLKQMREGKLRNLLFIGTGALMSPMTVQQGLPIPGVAHLLHLRMP